METFSALLAFFEGNPRWLVDSHHKGQWRGALVFSLICTWTNYWAKNETPVIWNAIVSLWSNCNEWRHVAIWRQLPKFQIYKRIDIFIDTFLSITQFKSLKLLRGFRFSASQNISIIIGNAMSPCNEPWKFAIKSNAKPFIWKPISMLLYY